MLLRSFNKREKELNQVIILFTNIFYRKSLNGNKIDINPNATICLWLSRKHISFILPCLSKYITSLGLDFFFNVFECLRFTLDFVLGHMSAI